MVHTFEINGKHLIYDTESGSLFEGDEAMTAAVHARQGEPCRCVLEGDYTEAQREIDELIAQGLLFAEDAAVFIPPVSGEVKALCLHISHDCNLRCAYCFADEGKYLGEREVMSLQVALASIDFLIRASGKRKNLEVDFFGGEPLMNFETVRKTVEYAKQKAAANGKNIKFTLTTNALLLTEEIAQYLNREMDNVVLSIDGRKSVHDRVRKTAGGKGSYDIALKNAIRFKAVRGERSYYVRGTFTGYQLDFEKDVLHLNDCGFDQISIEPVVLEECSPMAIRREHIEKINRSYEALAKEYVIRRQNRDTWFNFFHFYIDMDNPPCMTKRLKGCGAGNEYLAVSPDGALYPCHRFVGDEKYKMGDVFEKRVDETIRGYFAGSCLATKPACKDCFAKYHCSGGCAANNLTYAGDINAPYELSCEMMRKRLECALYVYACEHE